MTRRLRRCARRSATSRPRETKKSLGFHSASTITPERRGAHWRAGPRRVRPPRRVQAYRVAGPVTVDVAFKNYMPAEVLAYLPMFERADSHSIRFRAKDMVEASLIMTFIGEYRIDITP